MYHYNKQSIKRFSVIYLVVWMLSVVVFWFFTNESDAMGYGFLYLWIIIPVTTFTISVIIGKNNYPTKLLLLISAILGVMYMLVEYITFTLSNMISFHTFHTPKFELLMYGFLISLLGIILGKFYSKLYSKFHK